MTRINTNVSSLSAQNRLNRTNNDLQTSLTRLSTGLRINNGKDDPAGLIASEALRSDITSINKALTNTQRANQIIGTADSALGQVSSLLNDIRGLVTEAANQGALSDDEIAANQLQIDSSLEAINRIAQTTTFQGRRLLDGSLDFQVSQGVGFDSVRDLQVDGANLGASGNVGVSVEITSAATRAIVTADVPDANASSKATASFTFGDTTIGAEATGTVNLTTSFFGGTEAAGNIALDNAKVAFVEANGTLTLASGAALSITAKDGTVVDGEVGNNVKINVTTGTSTTASFDVESNTLSLQLKAGDTAANAVTALNGISAVSSLFTFSGGNSTNVAAPDAGVRTGVLSGGTSTLPQTYTQASETAVEFNSTPTNGFKFDIAAVAGGSFDGARGKQTDFIFTIANTGGTSASFDAANNKVTLTIDRSQTVSAIETAINTALSGQFKFSGGVTQGTLADLAVPATVTNPLQTGGTDTAVAAGSRAGFKLAAVDGGAADGTIGNDTKLNFIQAASGIESTAVYDAATNELNVTVGRGADVNSIAAAINAEGTFSAYDTRYGKAIFDSAAFGTIATPLSTTAGTNTTAPSSFKLTAVDGGLADGATGNSTKLIFSTGSTTEVIYDQASNELRVTVGANASVQNVADAITANVGGVFSVSNVANGGAKFNRTPSNADLGTKTGVLTGGTTNASNLEDELIVTAAATGVSLNGVKITFEEDATVAAGAPTAKYTAATGSADGSILVKVSNAGSTKLSDIAAAINAIQDANNNPLFAASLSPTSNGDGVYTGATESVPTAATLSGGAQGGGLQADLVFQLTGGTGSEVFKFKKGVSIDNIIQSINLLKDSTGIEASIDEDSNLEFRSVEYGSAGIVGIEVLSEGAGGTFKSGLTGGPRAVGNDVQATVNGTVATGKGNNISLRTSTLSFNLTVQDGSSTAVNFNINGGGALFQLGPDVVSNQQARLGITSLNTAKIGGVSGKLLELASSGNSSLTKDVTRASAIVDQVINKVTTLRGRLGAFQRTALESNVVSLNDTLANLNEAQSSIRDADFAKESANLTRAQILVQSGTSVLGIANQSAQSVLSLLR
jgi:flagellin-like hook-associated protein FlgL